MRARLAVLLMLVTGLVLPGCNGNPPPFDTDLVLCLATCDGTCVKNEDGIWKCVPNEPPPPPEPQCEGEDACDCYRGEEWVECGGDDPCDLCLPHQSCVGGVCIGPPDTRPVCNQPPDALKCDCWNHPPGGEWEWKECTAPPPSPGGCSPPEGALVATPGGNAEAHAEVKAATDALGSLPGKTPKQKLQALAAKATEDTGWCWFAGVEAVFVIRQDDTWGEYHAVSFDDGGWTNGGKGKWKGRHIDERLTDVRLPYPDPRTVRLKLVVHNEPSRKRIDTTLTTVGALDYCRAIRMGKYGDLPRAGCPVRPEGHRDREAWERVVLGQQTHACNGEPMPYLDGNPAVAKGVCRGHYRTCSEDGAVCTEVTLS